jgi:hypothetical protein
MNENCLFYKRFKTKRLRKKQTKKLAIYNTGGEVYFLFGKNTRRYWFCGNKETSHVGACHKLPNEPPHWMKEKEILTDNNFHALYKSVAFSYHNGYNEGLIRINDKYSKMQLSPALLTKELHGRFAEYISSLAEMDADIIHDNLPRLLSIGEMLPEFLYNDNIKSIYMEDYLIIEEAVDKFNKNNPILAGMMHLDDLYAKTELAIFD